MLGWVSYQEQLRAHLCIVWLQRGCAQAVSYGLCMLPQGLPRGRPVRMQHSCKGLARGMLQLQRLAIVLYCLLRLGGLQRAAQIMEALSMTADPTDIAAALLSCSAAAKQMLKGFSSCRALLY